MNPGKPSVHWAARVLVIVAITAVVVQGPSTAPAAEIGPQVSIVGGPPPISGYENASVAFWAGSVPQVTTGIQYGIAPDGTQLLLD